MAKVKKQEQENLDEFNWDNEGTEDFFEIDTSQEANLEEEEEQEEEENDNDSKKSKQTIKKKQQEEEEEKEEEEDENDEEEEDEPFNFEDDNQEEEEEEEQLPDYNALVGSMKDKGIFQNVEIEEGTEINEDTFIDLQDQEIEARVGEALEAFMEELDSDGAAFLKFKKEGGKTEDFLKTYRDSLSVPEGDLEEEAFQEKLNRFYYSTIEELDAEDIDDRIEWLKDSGKLKKFAAKHDKEIKELHKEQREALQKQAEEQEKQKQDSREAFVKSVKKTLDENDQIDNLILTPKKRRDLHAFITKPTVKVGKNRYVTSMHSKLQEALKDPEKMYVLADLLMTDFDFSGIAKAAVTKNTKKIKKNLQRASTRRPSTSGRGAKKRSLADFF